MSNTDLKSEAPKAIPCLACWSDLLGFGAQLDAIHWSLDVAGVNDVLERLLLAHAQTVRLLSPAETALVLNDGIVRSIDTDPNFQFGMWLWLHLVLRTHWNIFAQERHLGLPGIRTVISAGHRLEYSLESMSLDDHFRLQGAGKVPTEIWPEIVNRVVLFNPFSLQMNLAFARAYTIEELCSRFGVRGPCLLIDDVAIAALEDAFNYHNLVQCGDEVRFDFGEGDRLVSSLMLQRAATDIRYASTTFSIWRVLSYSPADQPSGTVIDFVAPDIKSEAQTLNSWGVMPPLPASWKRGAVSKDGEPICAAPRYNES